MMMLRILVTIVAIAIVNATVNDNNIIDDVDPNTLYGQDLVDYINDLHTTWKAVPNGKFDRVSNAVKYGMLGVNNIRQLYERNEELTLAGDRDDDDNENDLPDSFDSRMQWPQCRSLNNIRDQSSCGSCWAFGAVEAMSDRICIASAGKIQVTLSADDLLSCCSSCGFGCNGGDPMAAWRYWVSDGIVTGSNYTEKHGCRPYPFPPCEHHSNKTHFPSCQHDLFPTPRCDRQCQPAYTKKSYADDKHYGSSAYAVASNAAAIQKEIMTHGPVEAAFEVYEDFLVYGGGVYQHKAGKFGGGHAVKMIGWGVDNGVDYWLVANSWNTDWGENGMFRILRGSDECGIESGIVAGIPKINLTKKHHQHSNVHRHLKNVMSFA